MAFYRNQSPSVIYEWSWENIKKKLVCREGEAGEVPEELLLQHVPVTYKV